MEKKMKNKNKAMEMFEIKKKEYAGAIGQIQSKKSKMDLRKHPFGR